MPDGRSFFTIDASGGSFWIDSRRLFSTSGVSEKGGGLC